MTGSRKLKYEVRVTLIMINLLHFTSSLVITFRPGFRSPVAGQFKCHLLCLWISSILKCSPLTVGLLAKFYVSSILSWIFYFCLGCYPFSHRLTWPLTCLLGDNFLYQHVVVDQQSPIFILSSIFWLVCIINISVYLFYSVLQFPSLVWL